MLQLFPEGFEEIEHMDGVELVAYTDSGGEERLWQVFGSASGTDVASGWEDRWRDFHRPVRVGDLWIGPPWHEPPADGIGVVIDPGRAFGTGAHPTTRLCLRLLDRLPRGSVLDVGCGSGVLSIAAAKLGFEPVFAVDVDEHAVAAAEANARANGVCIEASRLDARTESLPAAEIVIVNVTRELVEAVAPRVSTRRLVASGYLLQDVAPLRGFRHVARVTDGGWAADLHEREPE
jgi:ribosomal protein L11 methyltransferase